MDDVERVTAGSAQGKVLHTDVAAGTRAVFDNHRMTEGRPEPIRNPARANVENTDKRGP